MEAAAILSAALNRADARAFTLALAVGLSVCWPLSPDGMGADQWYLQLSVIELCVFLVAVVVRVPASPIVACIHLILMFLHSSQYFIAPYEGQPSLYPVVVPMLECVSLLSLCFTSKHFLRGYHGNVAG